MRRVRLEVAARPRLASPLRSGRRSADERSRSGIERASLARAAQSGLRRRPSAQF